MKKRIINLVVAVAISLTAILGVSTLVHTPAYAVDPADAAGDGLQAAGGGAGSGQRGLKASIKLVINVLLFVIGAVAVIMIVLGGLKYVLSNGDSTQVTSAKNTILYAVIGLVVALLAYAIVNFVIDAFKIS